MPLHRCAWCNEDVLDHETVDGLTLCNVCVPFRAFVVRTIDRERRQERAAVAQLHPRTGHVRTFPTDKTTAPGFSGPEAA